MFDKTDDYKMFLPGKPTEAAEAIAKMVKKGSGGFLPRLKVAQGISKTVTEGKAMVGDLLLGDKNLGKNVTVYVGPFRSHALQIDQKENKVTAQSFKQDDPVFKTIQRGQKQWTKGAQAGPEYLCWFPEQESFGLVHFTRGALKASIDMEAQAKKLAVISSELTGTKRRWPIFKVEPTEQKPFKAPEDDDRDEAMAQFVAPLKEEKGEAAGRAR